jgi:Mce-associated membrane protein
VTDPNPDAQPELATPQPAARSRGTPRGPLAAAVAAALVFALLAAVLAVLVASDEDPADELRSAAGEFGEVLVTYDHADPEAHREAVVERSTASFADEYESAFEEGLGALITELEASSQGFLKDVYLTEVQRGQALAIVVLDVESDGSAGPRRLFDVYVRLTMIQLDGEWLVDDVTDLSFGAAAGGGSDVTGDTSASTSPSLP